MRVGIAQINSALGDFDANAKKILTFTRQLSGKKCELVIFPECCLLGYHPFDLLERPEFVEQQLKVLNKLVTQLPVTLGVLIGFVSKNSSKLGKPYYNSVALISKGKIQKVFHKQLLPTGDVFDEARFIEAGELSKNFFTFKGNRFFLSICEDIWAWPDANGRSQYRENPIKKLPKKSLDLIINMSASPFYPGKMQTRMHMVTQTAKHLKAPMIFVNMIGAQDELIFDGQSFAVNRNGEMLFRSAAFSEDENVLDIAELKPWTTRPQLEPLAELHSALVLGIRDFCLKTGLKKVVLGLSGGIDSALVLALAADALGPANVLAVQLPSQFTSELSESSARKMAKILSVDLKEISIQSDFNNLSQQLERLLNLKDRSSVAFENIQARLRAVYLMGLANLENRLLLSTSNKDELACGYSTLYGDMCGGLAPLGDLTKGQIFALAKWYNRDGEVIPSEIIDRPPSAELRETQKDQDSLPPYVELDKTVIQMVEQCRYAKNSADKWLIQQLHKSEFKRWQAPPVLKVSLHSFGRGRRYPIATKSLF